MQFIWTLGQGSECSKTSIKSLLCNTIISRWVWLGTVLPIQNITGGFLTFIMMTYSFIADNSTQRERMIRIGLCSFSWQVARPLSYPIGAWLFDSGGYVRVFSASLILYVIASIIGVISLWNFREKKQKQSTTLSGISNLDIEINFPQVFLSFS